VLGLSVIYLLKHTFSFTRPFCSELPFVVQITRQSLEIVPCTHSFPSGHTAFSSIIVASLWPLLNRIGKLLGTGFVLVVMTSRSAAGVHFPADLFWALIISVTITYLISKYVNNILDKPLYKHIQFFKTPTREGRA